MPDMIASVVRVPWHTAHGGYDRLLDHLPEVRRIAPPARPGLRHAVAGVHRLLARRCPLPFYPAEHMAADLRVLASSLPAHVLYGDEQYWFSRHRCVPTAVTYHQPPARLKHLLPAAQWRRLAPTVQEIVVLDPRQKEFFADLIPADRVHVVPHGIDTSHFTPDPALSGMPERPLVLTVGWWLRDWTVLDAVHTRLHHTYGSEVDLVVVTRDAARRTWHPAARVLEGISEAALVGLYRRATVMFLPLTDASANNALLEALACGVPVVVTDVGGIPFYTGGTPAACLVPPGDETAATTAIRHLLDEPEADHVLRRRAAREHAEHFAWPRIAGQIRQVHRLLEGDRR